MSDTNVTGPQDPPGEIPPSLLDSLLLVPHDQHAALLMRHSYRGKIDPKVKDEVDLTPEGVTLAEQLGTQLAHRSPGRLVASPIPRCMSTARAIAQGAGWNLAPREDQLMASPFTADREKVREIWASTPIPRTMEVVQLVLSAPEPPSGWRTPAAGVRLILDALLEQLDRPGSLDVWVTHDLILALFLEHLLRPNLEKVPRFLEGVFVWREGETLHLAWRGARYQLPWIRN